MVVPSLVAVAMMAPRPLGSINQALREVAVALGPRAAQITGGPARDVAPPTAAPFGTGLVAARRHAAVEALGPLIVPGYQFFEFLIDIGAWSFRMLRLPEVIWWVLSGPVLAMGEVMLVEQSRSNLVWPVDVVLGVGNGVIFSGPWRAFTLDYHLLIGDCLVFRFKLGMLEVSVWVFDANSVCHTYPLPALEE
jgi:hypothetical protein